VPDRLARRSSSLWIWTDSSSFALYTPTGELELKINESSGRGLRRAWSDSEARRLETQLNDVLAGIVLVADAKRTDRIRLERQRHEWAEAERRRQAIEERRRRELERFQELERRAEAWARSQRLSAYIDAVEGAAKESVAPSAGLDEVQRWLEWARREADAINPIKTATHEGTSTTADAASGRW